MRVFIFACVALSSLSAIAEGRLSAIGPPPEDEAVKELLDSMSSACSKKDFRTFMDCFTPKKAASIRKVAEDAFICGTVDVEVMEFFVLSSDEESVSFGLKYKMGGSEGAVMSSKIVAKRCDGVLKIDSEIVKSVKHSNPPPTTVVGRAAANPCANGRCEVRAPGAPVAWRHPNPANGGEEEWLPRDIMYVPGPSCANGNCGVR